MILNRCIPICKLKEVSEKLKICIKLKRDDSFKQDRIYGDKKKSEALKEIKEEIADKKKDLALFEKEPIKYLEKEIKSYERTIAF